MRTVYVIHDPQDRGFVEHTLLRPLPPLGVESWASRRHLRPVAGGGVLPPDRAMAESDLILVVVSPAAVGSAPVCEEVAWALQSARPLIPVRIAGTAPELINKALAALPHVELYLAAGVPDTERLGRDFAELIPPAPVMDAGPDDDVETEAAPEDYLDRTGYDASFLGSGLLVPLPVVTGNRTDVLDFPVDGRTESVLQYQHFSVAMSRSRRMCLFSAANIDGKESKKKKRVGWRTDPRIPRAAQIRDECYGNAPRFARGHMTRREDPVWGSDSAAATGNADSMHVTNAVPQMQPFNAGIWLGLEDYALDHAREDDMRISVFTGPIFTAQDPVRFNVRIPVRFWKVIAFVHEETGELCATGYVLSQHAFLREEEFLFGQHETSQVSIASIETATGLSFGPLAAADPFEEVEGPAPPPLTDFGQIQLLQRR